MDGRLFLGTLGFHENFIARTLHTFAAGKSDGLLLITLHPVVKGVEIAMNNLYSLSLSLGIIKHDHIEVNPFNPLEGIGLIHDKLISIAERKGYSEVIADLTGGPRIVVVSTLLALLLVSDKIPVRLIVQDETGGGGLLDLVLSPVLQALKGMGVKERILKLTVDRPGLRQEEIAEALGVSDKTAANYISQLVKLGLVARKGRARGVYPTSLGMLISRLIR